MKFKSASSNPRVMSSYSRVTSSNPRVTSSNPQITSSDSRNIKSMKIQVNSLKSLPFSQIISPKLFGNPWGNSYVQFLVIISCFAFPLLRGYALQQEAEWVNINFGRRDLNSPPAPMILEKFAFCFVFNLRKQYVTDFFSVSVTQNFVLCL